MAIVSIKAPCGHVIEFAEGSFDHGDPILCSTCTDGFIYDETAGTLEYEDDFDSKYDEYDGEYDDAEEEVDNEEEN